MDLEIDSLPVEVLPHIFKFLPLPDRKRVRLTCKLWNDACNHPTIVEREKFVFRAENNDMMPLLSDCILCCERVRSHFEFQGVSLRQLQSIWWKTCGDRLTSLILFNCDVDSVTLQNIILYCSNLRVLNIRPYEERTYSESLLDYFIASRIERKNLVSLNLYAIEVSNDWYQKLFLIYPNIRTLSQQSITARGMVLPTKLDSFTYWAKSNCLWMVPLCRNPSFKFRTLDISLDLSIGSVKSINAVTDFFTNQSDLEKIELAIFADKNSRTRELKALIFSIVKRLPKLRELAVRGTHIRLSSAEFSEFLLLISRLESFEFFDTLYIPKPVELLQLPTSMCHKMKKLQLPFYRDGLEEDHAEQICLAILSQSYYLQYLSLGFVTEKILRRILKIHTELRALFLYFCGKVDNDSGSKCLVARNENPVDLNIEYSISQLRKLEHLEICGLENSDAFETLFSGFELPVLKCLHFSTSRMENKEPEARTSFAHRLLTIVSSGAPCLEYLELRFGLSNSYHVTLSMNELKKSCKELKYLRFFRTDAYLETRKKNDFFEEAKQLLMECPSLSYITHGQNTLTYDRFSRQLKMYPSLFLKIPCCKPANFH